MPLATAIASWILTVHADSTGHPARPAAHRTGVCQIKTSPTTRIRGIVQWLAAVAADVCDRVSHPPLVRVAKRRPVPHPAMLIAHPGHDSWLGAHHAAIFRAQPILPDFGARNAYIQMPLTQHLRGWRHRRSAVLANALLLPTIPPALANGPLLSLRGRSGHSQFNQYFTSETVRNLLVALGGARSKCSPGSISPAATPF